MFKKVRGLALSGLVLLQFAMPSQGALANSPTPNPLYSTGSAETSIRPEAVAQGKVGDCYFLSALADLANLNPGVIDKMIKTNPDGTYTVTFPGAPDEPITVNAPTASELSTYAKDIGYGTWVAVAEKAYGVYCSRHFWRRTIDMPFASNVPQENTDGSYFHAGIRILTGGGVSTDWTMTTSYSSMMNKLTNAFNDNKLVTVDTGSSPNSEGLPTLHEYSVLAFQANETEPKLSVVTIRNPWGDTEPIDSSRGARDGVNDGVFKMTLEQMATVFHSVAIGDTAVPVVEKTRTVTAAEATATAPYVAPVVEDWRPHTVIKEDGTKVTTQMYRPTIVERTDGTVVKTYGDGSVATTNADGSYHLVTSEGREYFELTDGTRVWHNTDGSKETVKPDGTDVLVLPDGGVVTELPDGSKVYEYSTSDGSRYRETLKADGTRVVENADGTTVTTAATPTDTVSPVAFASLTEEAKAGHVTCTMFGDGETTTHCMLLLENLTDTDEHINIPQYECFTAAGENSQVMMSTAEENVNVPAHGETSIILPTVCAGTKTQIPPVAEGQAYEPSAPEGHLDVIKCIVEASESLTRKGAYTATPVARDHQKETFGQLAIWMENGEKPVDKINARTIEKDLCAKAGINTAKLGSHQRHQFDAAIDQIFAAADLTRKEGRKLASQRQT